MTFRPLTPARRRRAPALWAVLMLCLSVAVALVPPLAGTAAPAAAAVCPCSVFSGTDAPAVVEEADTSAVELGMKFRANVDGYVTGVRFYKGTGNTGTHLGRLWDSAGSLLASATFTDETASGWQQVLFSGPVAVTANTTYVVSYYAPGGRYSLNSGFFSNAGVDNGPLQALRDGVDGPNGVYRYGTGGGFPSNTWQAANYWVDVVFETTVVDTVAPVLTSRSPAASATEVPPSTAVSATFSEPVQSAAISLRSSDGTVTSGTSAYDSGTRTLTFTPASSLALTATYTATVTGATDAAGNTMAPDSWSFTTASSESAVYTIWPDSATPEVASVADASAVELGVKFRTASDGYVTGIRFYKGPQNTGQHVGTLWTTGAQALASVTFANESGSGWQTARFTAPVAVKAGATYVASYHTTSGYYSATPDGFLDSGVTSGPLTALQSGVDSGNGVYQYGGGGFPSNTYRATNYWVDVLFETNAKDTIAPTVTARVPAPDATGVSVATTASATFSEAVSASSIQMQLFDGATAVPATSSYDASTYTATLTPSNDLKSGQSYSVSVSGATDTAGNTMSGTVSWSFSTANASATAPEQGPGGPVLVVTNKASTDSAFAPFTAEILRAEGLNEFATADLSAVTADVLAGYDVVILGRTPLTTAQVTLFTDWVTAGGNLVAFRPTAALGALLGLSGPASAVTERYIKVDTTQTPGAGITGETMQTHGAADQWSVNGATAVATLYSNATTPTSNPAVTVRSVGTNGGEAASFAYDLPQSIVYLRQGNPAWDGQNRDSDAVTRSNDLYYGGKSTDWVNLSKVAIPQADEQQRLLANLIQHVNRDRKPLPRFWYFPQGAKAVVVSTGDDHASGGTAGRFDQYTANSPSGCGVTDWQCLRSASYVFPNSPLTAEQAQAYTASGFEPALHPQNGCTDYTASDLAPTYTNGLAEWGTKYSGVPSPITSRYHCIVWSDWATQAKVQAQHGIRLDTNYYYYPGSWVGDRPGFMTGSGMPMRFADKAGAVIDVYQAATQLTDESNQSYPYTPDTLLDNALGPLGYYGAFTANMHTDQATIFENDQLIGSVLARGVPMVSSRQLLTWLDGRNASSFKNLAWASSSLSFDIAMGEGANGLTALLPTAGPGGSVLSGITRAGTPLAYTTKLIKGIEYAEFAAQPGSHVATYGAAATSTSGTTTTASTSDLSGQGIVLASMDSDTATLTTASEPAATTEGDLTVVSTPDEDTKSGAPTISDVQVFSLPDGTTSVSWETDERADSTVVFGEGSLSERLYSGNRTREHAVVLTRLQPSTTYQYRVESVDPAGNRTVYPAASAKPLTFVTAGHGVADRSAAQYRMRGGGSGTYLQQDVFGELSLAPEEGLEFDRPGLPRSWTQEPETVGGRAVVTGGALLLDGQRAGRQGTSPQGGSLEFSATFQGDGRQLTGWAAGTVDAPFAMFELRDGTLHATLNSQRTESVALPADLLGSAQDYRIDWSKSGAAFFVDGRQVASLRGNLPAMRPQARDLTADDVPLEVEWVRLANYASTGSSVSRVIDAREMVTWDRATWRAEVPTGTSLRISVRTGSTPRPDTSWSEWTVLSGSGARVMGESRYLQYRVEMTTSSPRVTPVLHGIGFTNNGIPPLHIGETS